MKDDIRIPTHLKPELYQIELLPFIIQNNFTIRGKLELTMLCEQESTNVTLHTKNLVLCPVHLIFKGFKLASNI